MRRLSTQLKRMHYGALALLVVVLAGTVFWVSREHTRLARDSGAALVQSAMNTMEEKVRTTNTDYSYWVEAYDAARLDDFDWLDSNIGTAVTETMLLLDKIVITRGRDAVHSAWEPGGRAAPDAVIVPPRIVAALIGQIEALPIANRTVASSYQRIGDAVWFFAIARILPYEFDTAAMAVERPYYQIHAVEIDPQRLAAAGNAVLLTGLRLVPPEGLEPDWLQLRDHLGETVAGVAFDLPSPGTQILGKIAAPLGGALLLVIGAGVLLSRIAERSAERLERALADARAADRAKSEFLASISHELRTPMNGVITIAQMMQETDLDPEQREMMDHLVGSARSHMELLEHILNFGRIESGERDLGREPFTLRPVIDEIVRHATQSAARKGLDFETEVGETLRDADLVGDKVAIKQVLNNLVGNAIKYTDTGRVSLRVTGVARGGDMALSFAVADTGRGIAEADLGRIFERFTQLDSKIDGRADGAGLGLAICASLVEMMGGRITVESRPGHGSVFTFEVAVAIAEDAGVADGLAA